MIQSAVRGAIWDGEALMGAMSAAVAVLETEKAAINALNVFPVPDGDTGTNMALTLRAALDETADLEPEEAAHAGRVAECLARGALMGARGNSGVILSQILRGFARAINGSERLDGRDLANGLAGATEFAYQAVLEPVEGTILTVIRVAAERAATAASETPDLPSVLAAALAGARDALADTPNLLAILRQAGVVDAGGKGLVAIFEGFERYVRGDALDRYVAEEAGVSVSDMAFLDHIDALHGTDVFGYCTNFMIFGEHMDVDRIRADLTTFGTSTVIVGDDEMVKVHIHTTNPGRVLEVALHYGELGQIKIDNMSAQTRDLRAARDARKPVAPPPHLPPVGKQAVLAVASGEGLIRALLDMGATGIIPGGQTMNPSIEELLAAVHDAPTQEVILLPNNPNLLLAAHHVTQLTTKRVRVVPSRSIPQALAALTAFNVNADLDRNARAMTDTLATVCTIEVARADKDASIGGIHVRKGEAIVLVNERLVASAEDEREAIFQALSHCSPDTAELLTIFAGAETSPTDMHVLASAIKERYPSLDVQTHPGGQPHYRYIMSIE
jgi:DAK2 domain fusion protein YloV